jgi:hypothetical protein
MADRNDWSFNACQERLYQATAAILTREREYAAAVERKADSEAVYRNELAKQYQRHRKDNGSAVAEAELLARADAAVHSRERDYATDMVKVAADRLQDARSSREALLPLVVWAREREGRAGS